MPPKGENQLNTGRIREVGLRPMTLKFGDIIEPTECALRVWTLKRTVTVDFPDLAPMWCYELRIGGRALHGAIHDRAR